MRKILLLLALCLPMALMAQEANENNDKDHAVYLELLGGSTMVGVSYDQRFKGNWHWGWRAGLAFAYSSSDNFLSGSSDERYWSVPVEINYLVGNRRNSLELGLGASLGIVNQHYLDAHVSQEEISQEDFDRYSSDYSLIPSRAGEMWSSLHYDQDAQKYFLQYVIGERKSSNPFGYYFFANIGYRHVAKSGFLFRAGLNPAFNFGGRHAISRAYGSDSFHKLSLGAYLGFGWAF